MRARLVGWRGTWASRKRIAEVTAIVLLAGASGCAAVGDRRAAPPVAADAAGNAAAATSSGFACPPAGMVVSFDDGTEWTYLGTLGGDAGVCVQRRRARDGTEQIQHALFNWATLPLPAEATWRQELAKLFPLRPGAGSRFFGWIPWRGRAEPVVEQREVLEQLPFQIGGQERAAWVIRHSRMMSSSSGARFVQRRWLDAETGAVLGIETETESANLGQLSPMRAVRLQMSGGP